MDFEKQKKNNPEIQFIWHTDDFWQNIGHCVALADPGPCHPRIFQNQIAFRTF